VAAFAFLFKAKAMPARSAKATDFGKEPPTSGPSLSGPSVGVVIRTKDRPVFVTRALKSVMAQSYGNWSIALVNDGGARAPLESALQTLRTAADEIAPTKLNVIHNARSQGRSAAFNMGARALETEFITCLDDDDTWAPDFLESLVSFHARLAPEVPDLGGVLAMVTALREEIEVNDGVQTVVPLGEDWLPQSFRRTDAFINPIAYAAYRQDLYPVQWMLNREAALAVGGFPENFNVMEDRAFMLRFLQHWQLALLDRHLAFHHRRVRRKEDTGQTVEMNTLDNPSYDWRLHADLSKLPLSGPSDAGPEAPVPAALGKLIRAAATTVLRELNDETSALWHKVDGDARSLGQRLSVLESRISERPVAPSVERHIPSECFHLSEALGPHNLGFPLARGVPFCGRLEMSMAAQVHGLMMHWNPVEGRFAVQVPQTGEWTALELDLDDFLGTAAGLKVTLSIEAFEGFLFETALSLRVQEVGRMGFRVQDNHVHHCPSGQITQFSRELTRHQLLAGTRPRLSIIFPRHAHNFRMVLRDLMINRC
jgi:glycosyltransferase involved in cell wall biosynthesis